RRDLRRVSGGPDLPRAGHPQRLFCAPLTPFLIDQTDRRYLGRVSRACLDPIWQWLCRDLMRFEAKTYTDDITLLMASESTAEAEQAARRFQDVAVERIRETLAVAKSDEKAGRRIAGQIGVSGALEHLRDVYTVMRSREALALVASRLPAVIGNL